MDSVRDRLGYRVDGVRLLSAHPDADDVRLRSHQLADGFAPQSPTLGQVADPIVSFEGGKWAFHAIA